MDGANPKGSNGRRISALFTWRSAVVGSDLRSTAKFVALALSLYMSERGDSCFPSLDTLAGDTSQSRSTVSGAIKTLVEEGWLEKKQGGGRGRSTRYAALVPSETVRENDSLETVRETAKPSGSRPETVREPSATTPIPRQGTTPKRARARDELFDALAIACDFRLDAMTKDASRLCAVAAAEIRRAGGTPEMIPAAVKTYQRIYNGAATTPKAIANHWPRIAPRQKAAVEVCPDCGVGGGRHVADCRSLAAA